MKKLFILFVVLAMLLGTLCSCNKVNEETSSDVTGAASTTVSIENDAETTSSEESEASDVISSETSSSTVESTPSKVTPPANTNSTESTASKVTPPANTNSTQNTPSKVTPSETTSSEAKPVYKSIDEFPKIVLEGDPVPFTISCKSESDSVSTKFRQAIVRTREELLALYEEYGFENYKYDFSLFKDIKNKYDDDYFKENALILIYAPLESCTYHYRFDCLVKKDQKLYVGLLEWVTSSVVEPDGSICADDMSCSYNYVVEVKKSDIEGINDIEVTDKFEIINASNDFNYKITYSTAPSEQTSSEKLPTIKLEKHIPTIDEDFKDDRVVVVLEHEYSFINEKIEKDYFKNTAVKISYVDDIYDFAIEGGIENHKMLNQENFCRILKVYLEEKGKQNVLDAIAEFEKRADVKFAEPEYNESISYDV